MKKLLTLLLGALSLHNVNGQLIDNYFPLGELDPVQVDEYKGSTYPEKTTTIYGVVGADGQGAFHGNEKYHTHTFSLRAWKERTALEKQRLIVLRPIAPDKDFFADVPAYSILRLEVYLNEDRNRAVLKVGEIIADPPQDLVEAREVLMQPVFMETEEFGTFTLNKKISWFEGEVTWNQMPVRLIIDAEKEEDIGDEFETLRELLVSQKVWKKLIDNYAVKELLPLKNEAWLGEDEHPFKKKKFIETYQLESISISKNGEFQFWHGDGDLFWGHSILIEGSLAEGPTNASISG